MCALLPPIEQNLSELFTLRGLTFNYVNKTALGPTVVATKWAMR